MKNVKLGLKLIGGFQLDAAPPAPNAAIEEAGADEQGKGFVFGAGIGEMRAPRVFLCYCICDR